jgi:hypothetical protein
MNWSRQKKGTKPEHNATEDGELKALLFSTIQQTKLDYDANCFKTTTVHHLNRESCLEKK